MFKEFGDKVNKHKTAIGLTLAIGLTPGCAVNPETGERELDPNFDKTVITTIGGAVLGGIIDGKKGAVRGAVIGGAGGFVWDRVEERFEKLEEQGINVERDGDSIILDIPSDITFDTNQSAINPNFYGPLNDISDVLRDYPELTIEVIGHTDYTGSDAYNQDLSERRADSVGEYISAQGVSPQRIDSYGLGEDYAAQPGTQSSPSKAQMQADRHVEIIVNEGHSYD